ncbi:AAA domain-containing protein [Actinomadura fibrosa]|uniref:AAA domain-containing protein n=1 Tax=Actinomadura fibrosa TaxID=111802 RepID=A0ABW2XCV8_9ACTN|nr:AAA domain-containing protein [Actinomadura fibrosa]
MGQGEGQHGREPAGRPSWLEEAVRAAQAQHQAATTGQRPSQGAQGTRIVGRARPDPVAGSGWYQVALRGTAFDPDRVSEAFLAPDDGADEHKFSLIETVQDGAVLRVRVGGHAPADGLVLHVKSEPGGMLTQALVDGLRGMRPNDLATAFATANLTPAEMRAGAPPGFNDGQRLAWAAGTAKGLSVVWGPPGTGKTAVIERILEDLLAHNKSVLLVSGTNVAVDNALLRAARSLDPEPGVLLRVGVPAVPEVAADARICLTRLQEEKLAGLVQQAEALSDRIRELRELPSVRQVKDAEQALEDFDATAYREARQRVRHRDEALRLRAKQAASEGARDDAVKRAEGARTALGTAERSWHETSDSQRFLQEAAALQDELDGYELDRGRAEATFVQWRNEHARLSHDLKVLDQRSLLNRMRDRAQRRQITEATAAAAAWTQRAGEDLERMNRIVASAAPGLSQRIANLLGAVAHSPEEIERRRRVYGAAVRAFETAQQDVRRQAATARGAAQAAAEAASLPHPTTGDLQLIARADEADWPWLHGRLPALRDAAAEPLEELADLEERHEATLDEWRKLGRNAARTLIAEARVVATTHAMLRLRRDIHRRTYDHVVIDEAAASTPAEVLYALGRGLEGAVLFGDFQQNEPIVDRGLDQRDTAVQAWLHRNPFTAVGVTDPRAAQAEPGCVALTTQYRFGPNITELANRVAYGGLLTTGGNAQDEIVLVDVDGLGDRLAGIRQANGSKCWPVGTLLARALAEHHLAQGEEKVGIVTPYRAQRRLTEDILADGGTSERAEVGTVHSFQGREFGTVVFDLVEDGTGWLSTGSPDGVKVFNVGATRARHRLYAVANAPAVRRSRDGSPLRALKTMVESRKIQVVRASDVLGLSQEEAPRTGVAYEVWDALRTYAKVVDVYDEDVLPAELVSRIKAAERSVWLWSPWTAKRAREFLPVLASAADRGVDVRVMILPEWDLARSANFGPFAEEVTARLDHVVHVRDQHQKIVVIDERLVFLGSMNVLSHARHGGRREIMTLFDSRHLAEHVLEHERADVLAHPPVCPQCGRVAEAGLRGRNNNRKLHWVCGGVTGTPVHWERPFPVASRGRNQRKR